MRIIFLFVAELLLLLVAIGYRSAQPAGHNKLKKANAHGELISYSEDIVPVLSRNCYSCHSKKDAAASIDLTNYDHVHFSVISHTLISKEGRFPDCLSTTNNYKKKRELRSAQLVKQWIDQGAIMN